MKTIVLSETKFLVDNRGNKGLVQIDGEIVLIDRKKTCSLHKCGGGTNGNVPVYGFPTERAWTEALKGFKEIELESQPELLALFDRVCKAHHGQFEPHN